MSYRLLLPYAISRTSESKNQYPVALPARDTPRDAAASNAEGGQETALKSGHQRAFKSGQLADLTRTEGGVAFTFSIQRLLITPQTLGFL
jgi:hypothetical protein